MQKYKILVQILTNSTKYLKSIVSEFNMIKIIDYGVKCQDRACKLYLTKKKKFIIL